MGCHTWTYKKFNHCTKSQQDTLIQTCNADLDYVFEPYEEYKKHTKRTAQEYMNSCEKGSEEYNAWKEYSSDARMKKDYNERLKKYEKFKSGINKDNILDYCKIIDDSADYHVVDNEVYVQIDFDEPFRVYGYPEETFTNKDELLAWLCTLEPKMVGFYDRQKNSEWVEGYTDDLVQNINKYFEKHGEDNLYIEFG